MTTSFHENILFTKLFVPKGKKRVESIPPLRLFHLTKGFGHNSVKSINTIKITIFNFLNFLSTL